MEVLVFLAILAVVWMLVLTAAVGASFWVLSRHNRVSAEHPTAAPLAWVLSPSSAARLHRRLRTAVGWVDQSSPAPGRPEATDDLQRRLVEEAVAVDAHLVRAARAPRSHRRGLLRQTRDQVTEVERLAVRVHRLQRPPTVPSTGRPAPSPDVAANLADLRQHLDLLDAAHAELEDLERHAGLGDAPEMPTPRQAARAHAPATPAAPAPGRPSATDEPAARPITVDGRVVDAEIVDRPPTPRPQPGT